MSQIIESKLSSPDELIEYRRVNQVCRTKIFVYIYMREIRKKKLST